MCLVDLELNVSVLCKKYLCTRRADASLTVTLPLRFMQLYCYEAALSELKDF